MTVSINEEWEPNIRDWPALPKAALSGLASRFVDLACRDSEADPAAVLATLLVRFGIEVGPVPHVRLGEDHHPARLFAVIVGASSKARKGTSGHLVQRLFDLKTLGEKEYVPAQVSPGPLSTGEGLVNRVRDPVQQWQIDKKISGGGELVTIDPGESNKRLFVLEEELAAALQCTKREGNTLSTILRTFWDSGNVEPLTKTNTIKTTGAHVGLVAHITFYELRQLLNEAQAFNGFANRFLWVCARREKLVSLPKAMPEKELQDLQDDVRTALEHSRRLEQIELLPEAYALWEREYPNLTQDHPGLVGSVINRSEAQVIRLAITYALLDQSDAICVDYLQSALAFWSYCQNSALYIFEGRESNPIAQRILAALENSPLTATELHKALGNSIPKNRLEAALKELLASKRITKQQEPSATKPRTIYALTEFSELSRSFQSLREDNSDNSDNSPVKQAVDLWTGQAEVVV